MAMEKIYPILKYDQDHDVMHIYCNDRCNEWNSSAIEIDEGIYRLTDDDTGDITGYKILDYKKKVKAFEQERQTFLSDSESDINYVQPSEI